MASEGSQGGLRPVVEYVPALPRPEPEPLLARPSGTRDFPERSRMHFEGDLAAKFLRRKGYKILSRDERTGLGELDLVAIDGQTVVFVEVKTRRSADLGHPSEAVTLDKQRRMTRLALARTSMGG